MARGLIGPSGLYKSLLASLKYLAHRDACRGQLPLIQRLTRTVKKDVSTHLSHGGFQI